MIDKISLYRSFDAVARTGSISAAAKTLYVTQPSVSTDVRQLEDLLGTTLFLRTNRGMKLTPEGEVLYGQVRNALAYFESGEDALRAMRGLSGGRLRIGASDMTLRFFLLDYIGKFYRKYPAIRLSITNHPTPQTLRELSEGNIDFGVVTDPIPPAAREELIFTPVRTIRDIFVCAPSHPLARERGVTGERLAAFPLMLLENTTSTRAYLSSMDPTLPEPAIELATSDLLIDFARRGIGVAGVVEDFAAAAIDAGELAKIDLRTPIPPRKMLLARHKKYPLGAAASAMVAMIEENDKNEPKEGELL